MIKKSIPFFQHIPHKSIDKFKGIIKDVVIINSGEDKVGDNIDEVFLSQIVEGGNAQSQGVKSRFGHPNMCDDALGTYIGRYKNFRVTDTAEGVKGVVADLHLDDLARKSPKGNLYDYVIGMATKADDMFGNSIVFSAGEPETKAVEVEGEEELVEKTFIRCKAFIASDLVDSPAATNSLFKDDNDFAAKTTAFLDANPELIARLKAKPEILANFLTKYLSNSPMSTPKKVVKKTTKTVSEEIAEGFGSIKSMLQQFVTKAANTKVEVTEKSIDIELESGQVAVVETDAAEPAIGDTVMIDGAPAEDGEHATADGRVITTEGGVISAITPAEMSEEEAGDASKEKKVKTPAKKDAKDEELETLRKENAELKKSLGEFKTEMEGIKELMKKTKSGGGTEKRETTFTKEKSAGAASGKFTKEDLRSKSTKNMTAEERLAALRKPVVTE